MFGLFGFLSVFFWKTEKELAEWGNLLWTGEYVWKTLLISVALGSVVGAVFAYFLYGAAEKKWRIRLPVRLTFRGKNGLPHKFGVWADKLTPGAVFVFSLLMILLAWLPAYLAYYPGICTYDFPIQMEQIVDNRIIAHHPIAHTMLLKGAAVLGREMFGSVNTGAAVYTAMQMSFLAAAMAYGMMTLQSLRVKSGWKAAALLYCMGYPFHWYLSISMTKDIVFSSFVLIFMTAMSSLALEGRCDLRMGRKELLLGASIVGIVLFRSNGRYALLVFLFFLCVALHRDRSGRGLWRRLLFCCGAAFIVGNLLSAALFRATDAEQGDRREMLSMPIQQLARTMVYHGGVGVTSEDDNSMGETDKALVNDFILEEAYRGYNPCLADPVKSHTNTYVVRYRPGDFARTYFRLLSQYPGDFINAALAVNAGFVYPDDVTHANVNVKENLSNLGYVQTFWDEGTLNVWGFYKDSKWESLHRALEEWADNNAYLGRPVLKYLFVPGVWIYLYLLLFGWLCIGRRFRLCLPLSLILGYYLTMFLGPTVQLRYLYPVMISLPFLALISCCRRMEND